MHQRSLLNDNSNNFFNQQLNYLIILKASAAKIKRKQ